MTDGLDQALANAGLALLNADTGPPQLIVYDGVVPPSPDVNRGYIVLYTTVSRPSEDLDNAADGRSRVWEARYILNCISSTAAGARALAQRGRTQLIDASPVIAGLSCGRIRLEESLPPQRDESTGPPVLNATETYRLKATS